MEDDRLDESAEYEAGFVYCKFPPGNLTAEESLLILIN